MNSMHVVLAFHGYNPFLVYCRELALGTISLTGDRAPTVNMIRTIVLTLCLPAQFSLTPNLDYFTPTF